eukprot:s4981_g2.t4
MSFNSMSESPKRLKLVESEICCCGTLMTAMLQKFWGLAVFASWGLLSAFIYRPQQLLHFLRNPSRIIAFWAFRGGELSCPAAFEFHAAQNKLGFAVAVPTDLKGWHQLRFGPGPGHDAACSTACLVRPRGGVCLDAALAMLQLLLDSGQAYRIQGYLSFLPKDLEPSLRTEQASASSFAPPLERLWALPMVVVEGIYRGQLQIRAVTSVAAPGSALEAAERSNTPWQETAFDAAAAASWPCTAEHPYPPVFDLKAIDDIEQSVAAALRRGVGPLDWQGRSAAPTGDCRSLAEVFAVSYARSLYAALERPEISGSEPCELRCMGHRRPGRRCQASEAVEVSWNRATGKTTVLAAGSMPVDFRKAVVPDTEDDIWTLETDLGLLLAMPFKATLSAQLVSGAAEPYLLTPGIKQARAGLDEAVNAWIRDPAASSL